MTLGEFDRRLRTIDPKLHLRYRGSEFPDVVGIFRGTDYLMRLSKGELYLNGFKSTSRIKRGRRTTVQILSKVLHLTIKQRAYLLWGIQ